MNKKGDQAKIMRQLVASLIAGIWGCSLVTAAPLNVVATTADLGAIAKAIGGARLEFSILARPTEDPHFVEPRPSLIVSPCTGQRFRNQMLWADVGTMLALEYCRHSGISAAMRSR